MHVLTGRYPHWARTSGKCYCQALYVIIVWPCLPLWYAAENRTPDCHGNWLISDSPISRVAVLVWHERLGQYLKCRSIAFVHIFMSFIMRRIHKQMCLTLVLMETIYRRHADWSIIRRPMAPQLPVSVQIAEWPRWSHTLVQENCLENSSQLLRSECLQFNRNSSCRW